MGFGVQRQQNIWDGGGRGWLLKNVRPRFKLYFYRLSLWTPVALTTTCLPRRTLSQALVEIPPIGKGIYRPDEAQWRDCRTDRHSPLRSFTTWQTLRRGFRDSLNHCRFCRGGTTAHQKWPDIRSRERRTWFLFSHWFTHGGRLVISMSEIPVIAWALIIHLDWFFWPKVIFKSTFISVIDKQDGLI